MVSKSQALLCDELPLIITRKLEPKNVRETRPIIMSLVDIFKFIIIII